MGLKEVQIGTLACLVDEASSPSVQMVLAHGYAMEPEQLAPLARAMGLPASLCFPRGPFPASIGGRSWWPMDEDIRRASLAGGPRDLCNTDPEGRSAARTALRKLIQVMQSRHPSVPLILAGFSQGGMLAVDTLVHEDIQVQGLVLLSSSRIAIDEWRPRLHKLSGLPVLVAHGTKDQDLAFAAGEGLRNELHSAGAEITWMPFEGGHETPLTVWRSVRRLALQIAQRSPRTLI